MLVRIFSGYDCHWQTIKVDSFSIAVFKCDCWFRNWLAVVQRFIKITTYRHYQL